MAHAIRQNNMRYWVGGGLLIAVLAAWYGYSEFGSGTSDVAPTVEAPAATEPAPATPTD